MKVVKPCQGFHCFHRKGKFSLLQAVARSCQARAIAQAQRTMTSSWLQQWLAATVAGCNSLWLQQWLAVTAAGCNSNILSIAPCQASPASGRALAHCQTGRSCFTRSPRSCIWSTSSKVHWQSMRSTSRRHCVPSTSQCLHVLPCQTKNVLIFLTSSGSNSATHS